MRKPINEKFEVGQVVRLDKDFRNTSLVTVVSQSPLKAFTKVKSETSTWEVCTYRLSVNEEMIAS